jgi:hypothetical protein
MIPPVGRLPEAPGLVAEMGYFVVHAPRQTGKTTTLRALSQELTTRRERSDPGLAVGEPSGVGQGVYQGVNDVVGV